jgi:hypothetical protein
MASCAPRVGLRFRMSQRAFLTRPKARWLHAPVTVQADSSSNPCATSQRARANIVAAT